MDTAKLEQILENVGDMALKRRARTILNGLNIQDTDKVLDAGGGDGYYSKVISEITKAAITLYDLDKNALNSARINLKDKNIEIMQGSIENMPFKENTFDKIVCTEVLEHVPNDNKALDELYRVLKPGGLLAITVPNKNFPFLWDPINWIMQNIFKHPIKKSIWNDFFAGIWSGHIRLYSVNELRNQICKHNYTIIEEKAITHLSLPFQHYVLNSMARMLYNGRLSEEMKKAISKFETHKVPQRPALVRFGFWLFNRVDKLNENTCITDSSVSIYVLCKK